jgi:hypothetical protein
VATPSLLAHSTSQLPAYLSEANIVSNAECKQNGLLADKRDVAVQPLWINVTGVEAADAHCARLGIVKALNEGYGG